MAMQIVVQTDLCQGHAECVMEAPGVFAHDKGDKHVRVLQPAPDETLRKAVLAAVKYCPTQALSVRED